MLGWLQKMVVGWVINFVVRQAMKFKNGLKWDLIIADLKVRIPALIPGEWLDEPATDFVVKVVEICQSVLSESLIEKVLELCADGKFLDALVLIKEAIIKSVFPEENLASLSHDDLDALVVKSVKVKFDKSFV